MLCFLCVLLMTFMRAVSGMPTSTQSDVAVLSGTNFSLHCSTNTSDELFWYRLSPGAESEDHIVEGSEVNRRFDSFYSVLHENQESTLTIVAVQSTAARYACVEKMTAKRVTAQVIVLESEPSCSRNVTGYVFKFTCVVTYSGDGNPVIIWTQLAGNEEKEVTIGIENRERVGLFLTHTSTLTVQTDESKRNHFQSYSYRYTVKFCLPDNATRPTDGRSCIFSQFPYIDEQATGTTSRTGEEGIAGNTAVLWWIVLIVVPLVIVSIVGFCCFRHFKRLREDQHPKGQHRAAEEGLVESPC